MSAEASTLSDLFKADILFSSFAATIAPPLGPKLIVSDTFHFGALPSTFDRLKIITEEDRITSNRDLTGISDLTYWRPLSLAHSYHY